MLPWWVGVALALLSYLLLHPLAASPLTVPAQPGQGTVVTDADVLALSLPVMSRMDWVLARTADKRTCVGGPGGPTSCARVRTLTPHV